MQKCVIVLGMFFSLWITGASAVQTLTSLDEGCRLFYPAVKNVTGWHMKTALPCPGGRVHGQGKVTLINAFQKPEEELNGFFSQGYWTDVLLTTPLQPVSSKEGPALLFLLAQDVQPAVSYLGYMIAQKNNPFYYSAFKLCSGTRVLLQTREDLVADSFKKQVMTRVLGAVKALCPAVSKITLFARTSEEVVPFLYGVLDAEKNTARFEIISEGETIREPESKTEDTSTFLYIPDPVVLSPLSEGDDPLENPYHLFLKSKITGQKIKGRARVHITPALHMDEPIKAVILGAVTAGWGVVEGYFSQSEDQTPIIQVLSWQLENDEGNQP